MKRSAAPDAWFRQAWDAASDAMALSDPEGVVVDANPAYYELYGYGPDEVLGKSFAVIFPEERRAESEAQYREVFRLREVPPAFESVVRRGDGSERIVESRIGFIEENGVRVAMLSVVRDVTEARRAVEEQARLQREKEVFLGGAAHDLRTPLATLKGTAQLMRRRLARATAAASDAAEAPAATQGASHGLDPAALESGLRTIEETATRMAGLIDDLMDVSRVRLGTQIPLRRRETDLVALARRAAAAHQAATTRHTLRVEAATPQLLGDWDADRLMRVLDNLLSNAIKYSPAGGTIEIALRPDGTWALLAVRDEGIGIPEADRAAVFQRFERASNAPDQVSGTGIGLTVVRQIVEHHGGSVSVWSEEGRGSTFTIRLPLTS